ncbi:Adenosine/AMP deaminase [Cordyceps fumosorosea ARSEF 2679]|uniref:Adenosine/AMP deaminase n=1 Tax=Cordyceps fumosorosea (strain ARSEF 2679) TaxID=1081104 RepID=A0A167Q418_CORFA|nr:Adenosine/AMP deaminase [Cordyceps fumosorosea ARSEF 2679]OAA57261.1 Adenosine/AMP deaminase [Cordyceps fumosorosea ARSEF 2679]
MDYVALPKIELHAHLTGSVSRRTLHDIWRRKKDAGETDLQDPLEVMPEGKFDFNVQSFFPLFSSYIYNLLTDAASVTEATTAALRDFRADGVAYLELRTTPRATPLLSAEAYVRVVLAALAAFNASQTDTRARLILSIDRRHDAATAASVADLAVRLRPGGLVVGVDLCGDPTARPGGEVRLFTPAFAEARGAGLGVTVHFAEGRASGAREELEVLLGWEPRRLGHVIWEDEAAKREIARRGLCLELCLSCNVRAEMVTGGYAGHHFGYWRGVDGPKISLATDDVGVFGSPLSKEYELAAEHFHLDRQAVCSLAREAIDSTFGSDEDKEWLRSIMWTS